MAVRSVFVFLKKSVRPTCQFSTTLTCRFSTTLYLSSLSQSLSLFYQHDGGRAKAGAGGAAGGGGGVVWVNGDAPPSTTMRGTRVKAVVALLAFKTAVTDEPSGVLSSWSDADADPCRWAGVTCASTRRRPRRDHTSSRRRHRREKIEAKLN